jgi:hypothetical protein
MQVRAAYDGMNYDSGVFTINVIKTPLSVNTITDYSQVIGSTTTDVATLTSAHDTASSTVTYALLDDSDSPYAGTKVTISSGKVVADTSSKFSVNLKI